MKDAKLRKLQMGSAILSILFAFFSVFLTYKSIKPFLIGGLIVLVTQFVVWFKIAGSSKDQKSKLSLIYPLVLVLVGAIGISAATTLTREKIELIKDPNRVASCSISPIVACSPVIGSDQASAVTGLPNPVFGIFGFGVLIMAGMSLLAGGKFVSWWWRLLWSGIFVAYVFCWWLIWESLYNIGALCLYCNVVWAIVIALFWLTSLYLVVNKHIKLPQNISNILIKYWPTVILVNYAVIILMIYLKFDYYWNSLI